MHFWIMHQITTPKLTKTADSVFFHGCLSGICKKPATLTVKRTVIQEALLEAEDVCIETMDEDEGGAEK